MIGSPAYIVDGYDLICNVTNGTGTLSANISWYHNGVLDTCKQNMSNADLTKDNGVVYILYSWEC